MRSVTPSGQVVHARADECPVFSANAGTSINRFTRPVPRSSATSAISRTARSRTP
jgi:hypothetical protein